jgi:hypothetical protein
MKTCRFCAMQTYSGGLAPIGDGWECKSRARCFDRLVQINKRLRDRLGKLDHIGIMMSNVCYNMGNSASVALDDEKRSQLGDLCKQWDAARRAG